MDAIADCVPVRKLCEKTPTDPQRGSQSYQRCERPKNRDCARERLNPADAANCRGMDIHLLFTSTRRYEEKKENVGVGTMPLIYAIH